MFRFIFFILLWGILSCMQAAAAATISKTESASTVQAIFSMFRHGDRSPIYFWPNDQYLNYQWPGGEGALSEKGVYQHYNLGKTMRRRYGHLLPQDGRYSQNNMLVISSFIERCVMSGQSLLAGFMPPQNEQYPVPFKWQPVPITTLAQYQDDMLSQYRPCDRYDRLFADFLKNPPADVQKLSAENKDIYKLLEATGRKNITYTDIGEVYDTFIIHRDNNLILPPWAKDIFPERMRPFAERAYSVYTETPYMQKVKGGPWVTDVYNKMLNKTKGTLKPDRNIFLYASHDSTIIGILNALGVLDQAARLPDYASMMVFELHRNEALNDFEVKLVYFNNSETKKPKEIHLPNCKSPCSLTSFGKAIEHLLIDDYETLCKDD